MARLTVPVAALESRQTPGPNGVSEARGPIGAGVEGLHCGAGEPRSRHLWALLLAPQVIGGQSLLVAMACIPLL